MFGDGMDVVLRVPLWTDLYRDCIAGLMWCAFVVGGVADNHDGLEQSGDATVSSRGLPRPTPVSG